MAIVESLDVQISVSAERTTKAIRHLTKSVGTLATSLKFDTSSLEKLEKINGDNLKKIGEGFQAFLSAAKNIQNIDNANFNKLATGLEKIASIDSSKLESLGKIDGNSFRGLGEGIKALSLGVKELQGIKAGDFNVLVKGLEKLGGMNYSGLENLSKTDWSSLKNLGEGTKFLADGMKNLQGIKASDFTPLVKGIEKLSMLQAGNMEAVGNALKPMSEGIKALNGAKFDNKNLQSFMNSLTRLSNANTASLANINFTTLGTSIKELSETLSGAEKIQQNTISMTNAIANLASTGANAEAVTSALPELGNKLKEFMQTMSSAGKVEMETISFTQAIGTLANAGKKAETTATANLPKISKDLQDFIRGLNGLKTINFDISGLANLVNSISKLGAKSVTSAIANMPLITTALKDMMTQLSTAPIVSRNIISMTNAVANLIRQIRSIPSASGTFTSSIGRVNSSVSKSHRQFKILTVNLKSLTQQLLAASGVYLSIYGAVRGFTKAIKSSMDYVEDLNYFNAAFGQVAENADLSSRKEAGYNSAQAYYDSFAKRAEQITQKMTGYQVSESGMLLSTGQKNLGINPSQLMNYQAVFGQMSSSMGVASENALILSDVLTKIGADLASVKNMDFNKVWEDMASGLAGMSRTLDKYGVNIRNVNLQQKLNELGIDANITALNQNEKALLRTIILLDTTRYSWADLSETINQPANQLRLVQANFSNLARTIGNIFLPIIAKALPYINAVAIALQRLAEKIVLLLGFKNFDWGGLGKNKGTTSDALSAIYDETEDISDAMSDATKKAKEFQNQLLGFDEVYKLSDPAENTSNAGAGLSAPDTAALDAAFKKIADEYRAAWDEAFKKMEQKSTAIADRISRYFNKIYKAAEPLRKSLKNLWNNGFKKLLKFKSDALKDFYNDFLKPLGKWTLGKGLPKLVNAINDFLNRINWDRLRRNLSNFWKGIEPFVEGFGEGFINFFAGLSKVGASVINGLGNAIGAFGTMLQKIGSDKVKAAGKILGEIAAALLTYNAVKGIATIIKNIGLAFQAFAKAITSASMLAVAGIIATITAALYDLVKTNLSPNIKISADVEEALNNMQKAIDKYQETRAKLREDISTIDTDFGGIQIMADKYYELSQRFDDLSESEKSLLSFYSKELTTSLPEITNYIDEQTGAFKGSKDQLQGIIDKPKEYYKLQAVEEFLKESYKAQAELQKQLQESNDNLEEQRKELEKAKKAYEDYGEEVGKHSTVFADIYRNATTAFGLNKEGEKLKELKDDYLRLAKEVAALEGANKELTESYESSIKDITYWETQAKVAYQNQEKTVEEYANTVEREALKVNNTYSGMGRNFEDTTSKMQSDSSNAVGRINLWLDKIKVPSLQINTDIFNNKVSNSVSDTNSRLSNLNTGVLQINTSPFNTNFYNAFNNANNLLANGLQTAKIDIDTNTAESKVQSFLNSINKSFGNIKLGFSAFGSTMNLPKYAAGGFPEDGLFYANHGELVGEFANGKTAVANNEQITEGIANAVYRAFVEANINAGGSSQQQPIIKVYIGNKEVEDIAIEGINNRIISSGKNPLYI